MRWEAFESVFFCIFVGSGWLDRLSGSACPDRAVWIELSGSGCLDRVVWKAVLESGRRRLISTLADTSKNSLSAILTKRLQSLRISLFIQ